MESGNPASRPDVTYILPIRSEAPQSGSELDRYLRWLADRAETIVVDGSPDNVFQTHARAWGDFLRHVAPAPDLLTPMGKVGGVLTGVRLAMNERIVVGDEDVRYDETSLRQVVDALQYADVVRPQNYFVPLPWHALWDTGRILLNRMMGGDWPGTVGVRRSALRATSGYDGRAMFENLELVRTVRAAGGREVALLDAYVLRRPSTARQFWSQRIRQAYDELARPLRLVSQLAILPAAVLVVATGRAAFLGLAAAAAILVAELGRRRQGAARYFPAAASPMVIAWLAERAVCSWLAIGSRVFLGGVAYRGRILRHAATPLRTLRALHRGKLRPPTELRRRPRRRLA
ncbi:MAG TPA: glycosyltransferase family 2 protein [Thermoanaerobaculia bacterium]|nr:glycosyltransferase family 2 protein [Thermoanaerobaculia bacterium]